MVVKKTVTVNLYDFDKTIYDGDSSLDFYLFCLKSKPSLIKHIPSQAGHALLFLIKIEAKTKFKGHFFCFVKSINNLDNYIEEFWKLNESKIKDWYLKQNGLNVIVSASPDFLLKKASKKLRAHKIIATKVNTRTGLIDGKNCFGVEKVRRIKEELPNIEFNAAYSDHKSDYPMLNLAKNRYMVRGNKITQL